LSWSVAAEQLPLGLVFAAEVDVIDQAVAIGIFGLPGDRDLLRGGMRGSVWVGVPAGAAVLTSPVSLTVTL
jgi:hypothetical protein